MDIDKNDIEEILDNWYKAKQEISLLEKKCERYKKCSEKIMNNFDKNNLITTKYNLKKINISRSTISKNDLPIDIWNKYSKSSSFTSYYLHPIKKS